MMNQLQYFEQIRKVMIQSGQLVMQRFGTDFEIFEKHGNSIVTAVDFENELFLKSQLAKIVPQAAFLAEESGFAGESSDYVWVIDALDGTKNFMKGIPHFCSMVALTYKNEPIVAAIYQPVTGQLYYAEKGKGLWVNGKQIKFVDRLMEQKAALVVCEQGDIQKIRLKLKEDNIQVSRRYFGSAGIDALFLVIGSIDLIVSKNIAWWDVAPGMLMIAEAGGLVYTYEKSQGNDRYGFFKAGNRLFF